MSNEDINKKASIEERFINGLIYAVIGTVIVLIIEYFKDLNFSFIRTSISFVLFLIFGYFIHKKNDKKRVD